MDASIPQYKEKPINAVARVTVAGDLMSASMTIDPPKYGGKEIDGDAIDYAIHQAKITYGLNATVIESIKKSPLYNNCYIIAKGTPPKNGSDGSITFCFETKVNAKPKMKHDGTVDYHDLGIVINVKQGQVLANIVQPTKGIEGMSVTGKKYLPSQGKSVPSPVGRNTALNGDETQLYATIDGTVALNGSRVVVSDSFVISNDIDTSTGNIKAVAGVNVLGSVQSGFLLEAGKNVEIGRNVEGGKVTAGGNIVIHGGVVGRNCSKITSGGNIECAFFENCEVVCGGSMKTESIMTSNIKVAGKLELYGMMAKLVGGRYVIGGDLIANDIGSFSNNPTEVILGADPTIVTRYSAVKTEIARLTDEIPKLKQIVEILNKMSLVSDLPYAKRKMLQNSELSLDKDIKQLQNDNEEYKNLNDVINNSGKGRITCKGTCFRGVKLTIGFATMVVENDITSSTFTFKDDKIVVTPSSFY